MTETKPKTKTRVIEIPDVIPELEELAIKYKFTQLSEDPLKISTAHLHPVQIAQLRIELNKNGFTKIGIAENYSFLELFKDLDRRI